MLPPNSLTTRALVSRWLVEQPLIACLYAAVILICIPPWLEFFRTGLGVHWDTHLMGQWMAWNAQNILDGKFLVPDYNANFFYPHSYTLAFSEPLWPQSFVYAAVFGATDNPFLSFNTTMLVFWAISGVSMMALLREFGLARGVCFFGGLLFCLLPHRLGYYIEFNMSLVFVLPLMILVTIRWLRAPSFGSSMMFLVGFWFSATSCLYYTIMSLLPMVALTLAFLWRTPAMLKDPKNWAYAVLVCVGVGVIAWVYLYPYALLRLEGGFVRTDADYIKHYAQAIHYISPTQPQQLYNALGLSFPFMNIRWNEAAAFPGTVLALLCAVFFVRNTMTRPDGAVVWNLARYLRGAAWLGFWLILIMAWAPWQPRPERMEITNFLPIIIIAIVLLVCVHFLHKARDKDESSMWLHAIGLGAVIAFFVSLGLFLTVGGGQSTIKLAENPLQFIFLDIPIFGATRGLSRFSIVVLVFLVIAGCVALAHLVRRRPKLWYAIAALPLVMIFEARQVGYFFDDDLRLYELPVARKVRQLPSTVSIVHLPLGHRNEDAIATLQTIGGFNKLVNGHSGFNPPYYENLIALARMWDIKSITHETDKIWPTPMLLVDRVALQHIARGQRQEYPTAAITSDWVEVETDRRYTLYKRKARIEDGVADVQKLVRSDVLRENPVVSFTASATGSTVEADVLLNGTVVGSTQVKTSWEKASITLPEKHIGNIAGDVVEIRSKSGEKSLRVKEVRFAPAQ